MPEQYEFDYRGIDPADLCQSPPPSWEEGKVGEWDVDRCCRQVLSCKEAFEDNPLWKPGSKNQKYGYDTGAQPIPEKGDNEIDGWYFREMEWSQGSVSAGKGEDGDEATGKAILRFRYRRHPHNRNVWVVEVEWKQTIEQSLSSEERESFMRWLGGAFDW